MVAALLMVLAAGLGVVPAATAGTDTQAFRDGAVRADSPAAGGLDREARPRIVGGTVLTSNASAAHTVAIQTQFGPTTFGGCSGTVLDALHVVTAAHCFVKDGMVATAENVRLGVGHHDIATPEGRAATTVVAAAALRVHPLYRASSFPDDIAVITLAAPLDLSTGKVAALPMVPVGTYLASGTAVRVTGFGASSSEAHDFGTLRSVTMRSQTAGLCGTDAPAVMLCTFRRGHAACEGDSGGTAAIDSGRVLVGVTDTAIKDCAAGLNLFANVAAPEIRAFIDAALAEQTLTPEQIQVAPRGGRTIRVTGTTRVGRLITCRRGTWSGKPRFRYSFVRIKGKREQSQKLNRKKTYRLQPSDRGWRITCAVEASNAGGTGVSLSPTLRTVR